MSSTIKINGRQVRDVGSATLHSILRAGEIDPWMRQVIETELAGREQATKSTPKPTPKPVTPAPAVGTDERSIRRYETEGWRRAK